MPFIGVQPASALLTSADIQDGQITTAKIADTAVTTAKVTDDAITGAKIENSPTIANGLTLTDGDISFASGHGINFASDTNASGSSDEILTDYEHGTWVPAVGGSTTYNSQVGRYVKVGDFVYLWFYLEINAHDGSYGANFSITGCPFTTNSSMGGSGNIHYFGSVGGGNPIALFTRVDPNNTQINVSGTTGASSSMANVNHNWANTNSASIYGNCQLYVA